MTLSSTTTKTTYSGDGATTAFATGFKFLQNSHVKVILRDENVSPVTETTWVEGTQYTLTGAGEASGGTVTVKTTPTDYTPASGEKLIVKRSAPETQGSALPAGGAFPSATVEQAVDLLTMLVQQHSEELARALVLAETSPTSGITLPEPAANQLWGWNSGATNLENKVAADLSLTTVTAFINTLLDDADAATARATLGAGTGNGDVSGPASSTDNAVARYNGTGGKTIQDSGWSLDDTNVLNGNDNPLQRVNLRDYGEVSQALAGTGNKTIDLTAGNSVTHTAFGPITWTFSNPTAAPALSGITLSLITGGIGAQTWPANVKWAGGTAPTLTSNTATFTTNFAVNNKLTVNAHGLNNGERVHVTSSGTLPNPPWADSIYFVINATANDFELSPTLGGSSITIANDGTGTHTLHYGEDKLVFETDNGGAYWVGALAVADAK